MSKEVKTKKPTKLEEITIAARQNSSHLHSASVVAKRELCQFEIDQLDGRLFALNSAISVAKERRAKLQAMVVGLGLILEKR